MLGVARETVRNWFTNNGQSANSCNENVSYKRPDAKGKFTPEEYEVIASRVKVEAMSPGQVPGFLFLGRVWS